MDGCHDRPTAALLDDLDRRAGDLPGVSGGRPDGQHAPEDIASLAAELARSRADIVLGSRFLGRAEGIGAWRRFTLKAAILFHWKSLRRQVRLEGPVSQTTVEEADAYFATRDRGSQIGAWASDQSRPLESRFALEKRVAAVAAMHVIGTVPRPPHWSGFRLQPLLIGEAGLIPDHEP